MKRPGTKMAAVLSALLLLALCCVTPTATAQDKTPQEQIDRLQRDLADLREEIRLLRIQLQLNSKLSDAETKTMLLDFEKRLARLEGSSSSSYYSPRRSFSIDPVVQTGTIRLVNELSVPATVTIGNRSYVLQAFGETTVSSQPIGTITYVVTADGYGVSAPRRTTVDANRTLTLTVTRPR